MTMPSRMLTLVYILLFPVLLHAQKRISQYHEQNGLLSDFTYRGVFDSNNYLWICSSRGLSRFDGTTFNHFTVKEGLPDNDIVKVVEDEAGIIWASAFQREVAFLEPGKTLFTNINTIIHPDTVRNDGSYQLFRLNKQTIALVSYKMIRLVRNKRWIKSYPVQPGGFPAYAEVFQNDKDDLVLFSPRQILLLHPSGTVDSLAQPFPYIWEEWEGHLLWLHCTDNSLVCIDTRKGESGIPVRKISLPDSISRFGPWDNDSLLLGAKNGRLVNIDRRNGLFSVRSESLLLSSTAVNKDKRVRVMFTRDQGIYVEVRADSSYYHELPAAPYSLLRRGNDIEVLDAQNCWLFPERLRGIQLPGYANRLGAEFTEIKSGVTWTYGNDVEVRDAAGKIKKLDFIFNIKDVYAGNDSIRYVAAQSGAFALNYRQHTQFKLYDKRTTCISEGMDHSVFMGIYHGLLQRLADGRLTDWRYAGLPDIRVTDLSFKDNVLWIATDGKGLWAIRNNKLYHLLDERSGLVSDAIETIASDGCQHLMIGYAKGVQRLTYHVQGDRIKIRELLTLHTIKGEGIKYLHYAAGKLYGIGSRGLLIVPEQWKAPVKNFRMQIDRVIIDGKPIEASKEYKLRTGSHDFSVSLSAVNYEQFPIRYRYRKNGEAWTYTVQPEISYRSLGPGNYHIEIQLLNNYAKPSSAQVFQITVQQPFYLRAGFLLVTTSSLLVLLITAFRLRYRYKYRKAQRAMQQEKQLRELELSALKAQINPHFVFNCLNSIKGLIYQEQLDEADLYMDHFARLFRSTLEGAATSYHNLSKEIAFINAYLSLEQVSVNHRFGFDISLQNHLKPDAIMIPSMLLQPYVENAVKHGISRLKKQGCIRVRFEQEEDHLVCIISDNGLGRGNGTAGKPGGKGMMITERRAQLYNIKTEVADNMPSGTVVRLTLSLKHSTEYDD